MDGRKETYNRQEECFESNVYVLSYYSHHSISHSHHTYNCDQSIRVSASASALLMNIQGWFPLGLTALTSLLPRGSQEFSQHHCSKASVFQCSVFFMVQLSILFMEWIHEWMSVQTINKYAKGYTRVLKI